MERVVVYGSMDIDDNALITPYTQQVGISDELLRKLYRLRTWDIESGVPVPLTWPSKLKKELSPGVELRLREYQKQGLHHLARLKRFILGDSVGLGKTLEAIAAACWLADHMPRMKVIVICTKSTSYQWASEFHRFSHLRARVVTDTYNKKKGHEARVQQIEEFLSQDAYDVLVCKYSSLTGKRKKMEGKFDDDGIPLINGREQISSETKAIQAILKPYKEQVILIVDEAQKFKGLGNSTNIMVQLMNKVSGRVWALTATAVKNTLDEFYIIATTIGISPHGNIHQFYAKFCIFREIHIGKGKNINKLEGYRNVAEFKAGMRPFFLGRSPRQVKEPMPRLVTQIVPIEMDKDQICLLEDIKAGGFTLPPALVKRHGEYFEKDRDPNHLMTALSVMQLITNHPALIDPSNEKEFFTSKLSPKEEMLLDLLDGELKGESVICFSKFKLHIDRLQRLTEQGKFTERKFLRITGDENEVEREDAKQKFQEPGNGYDFIIINAAGCEGINLQQASHMICLDLPFSFGENLQLIGRMLRVLSPHEVCTLHILMAKGTTDEFCIDILRGKREVFAKVLGDSALAGFLDDSDIVDLTTGMEKPGTNQEFASLMEAHVRSTGLKGFIDGSLIKEAQEAGDSYKMTYDQKGTKKKVKTQTNDEELMKLWE
jgi:SNF2 family DNA or RNA helicase